MKAIFFGLGTIVASVHGAATAQSGALPPQARAMAERIHQGARAECRDQRGTLRIENHAVSGADLNGDGVRDYLVDFGAYQCSTAASLYCGTLGCPVQTIVSSPSGYREIAFAITHSPTVLPNAGGDILEVDVRASDCGPRANRCIRYWRLIGSKFEMFTALAAARGARQIAAAPASRPATTPLPALTPLREGFRAMQLPNGMRVAALNGIGPMRTLSLGCRNGTATMLLATRAPARPAEVVIRTPARSFIATPAAVPRPDLWEFRLSDPALFNVLTSPEAGFSVSIGGVDAGQYSLANPGVVRSALAPCASAMKGPAVAAAPPPAVPSATSASAAPVGIMGIPIRRGYYVAAYERCERAVHIYRMDSNGHSEGFGGDGRLTFIKWKRATRKRDGSYDVEYAPSPGDMPGDEINITIKPINPDLFDLTIQDTVRLRRCEAAQMPAWARR